jgi:hypothetical protein
MNILLRDESQKECQTEVETLELRANTSFQETTDMKKEHSCCREGRETGSGATHHTNVNGRSGRWQRI